MNEEQYKELEIYSDYMRGEFQKVVDKLHGTFETYIEKCGVTYDSKNDKICKYVTETTDQFNDHMSKLGNDLREIDAKAHARHVDHIKSSRLQAAATIYSANKFLGVEYSVETVRRLEEEINLVFKCE